MKLFISYARVNMPFCQKLVQLLEAHEVWYDQKISGGQNWWQTILEKIEWCEGFIYLLSPDSIQSEHCEKECRLALKMGRVVIPVIIQSRTLSPQYLMHIQYVDLSKGLDDVSSVVNLMSSLFKAEREQPTNRIKPTIEDLSFEDSTPPKIDSVIIKGDHISLPYNYIFKLKQRGLSEQTRTVYSRWVCDFLENVAGQPHIAPQKRSEYLSKIPRNILVENLSIAQLNAWLGMQVSEGTNVAQAKSAILTLAEMLVEDEIIDEQSVYKLRTKTSISGSYSDKRPRKILTYEELEQFMIVSTQGESLIEIRNAVLVSLLLVLRTGEAVQAKWDNITMVDQLTYFSRIDGNQIKLPQITVTCLSRWRDILLNHSTTIELNGNIIRRFERFGKITEYGVSKNAANDTVSIISKKAGLGHISPEDLRISARRATELNKLDTIF